MTSFKILFFSISSSYIKIGHIETRNEWLPRLIKYLNMTVTGGAVRVFCGSTFSLVISGHKNLYIFGKNSNRQGQMYPIAVNDLCGVYHMSDMTSPIIIVRKHFSLFRFQKVSI